MKTITMFLALLLILSAAVAAGMDASKATTIRGQIVSVDVTEKMLTVKTNQGGGAPSNMTFVLNNESKLVKAGSAISLGELKADDAVTVTYKLVNNANVVVSVSAESKS